MSGAQRYLSLSDRVLVTDHQGREHQALVSAVLDPADPYSAIKAAPLSRGVNYQAASLFERPIQYSGVASPGTWRYPAASTQF